MKKENHPYHLVDKSPWPIMGSFSMLINITALIKWFTLNNLNFLMIGVTISLMIMFQWSRDIVHESTHQGQHTFKVTIGMRWGEILFIIS